MCENLVTVPSPQSAPLDWAAILDGLSDAVFVTRPDSTIQFANASAARILGYAPGELLGRSWMDLVSSIDALSLLGFEGLSQPEVFENMMVTLENVGGEPLTFVVSGTRFVRDELLVLSCRLAGSIQNELAETTRWAAALLEKTDELERARGVLTAANADLRAAQREVSASARLAGMAEIASEILHNVGNVLNSVGVSTALVRDALCDDKLASLSRVVALLENQPDLSAFFTQDPRGHKVLPFLRRAVEALEEQQSTVRSEVGAMARRVEHLKAIVARQRRFANAPPLVEKCDIHELLAETCRLVVPESEDGLVELKVDCAAVGKMEVDRHRLTRIVTSLLSNARKSVLASGCTPKRIEIGAHVVEPDDLWCIVFADNGVGIRPEHLEKVFEHGFTTQAGGEGFGLHEASNLASELGGRIACRSEGMEAGATFVLYLPLTPSPDSLRLP